MQTEVVGFWAFQDRRTPIGIWRGLLSQAAQCMNTGGAQAVTLDGPDKWGRDQQSWVAPVLSSWQRRALGAGSLGAFKMCSL